MEWSHVTSTPTTRTLRQFAGIWLVAFGGLAGWRAWHDQTGGVTVAIAALAGVVGLAGLLRPASIRLVYTGWMAAAFPVGWTMSRLMLGVSFYLVITPVAWMLRWTGRDALRLRRGGRESYWRPGAKPRSSDTYLRQF